MAQGKAAVDNPDRPEESKKRNSQDAHAGQSSHAAPPAKKQRGRPRKPVKASSPPSEYEDVWYDVYLSGTEWDQLKDVHKHEWDFSHLDDALTSGALSQAAAPDSLVHLFGCTEPQLVRTGPDDTRGSVVPIPVIVAVASSRPPPELVGIKSVQRAEEEILPMTALRMGWHPRPANNVPRRNPPPPRVHVLKCSERRARLRNMDEASVHLYDYVLPYVMKPGMEDDLNQDSAVQVLVDNLEGRANPVMMEFDYEMDTLDDFVEEQIESQELDKKKHEGPVRDAIRAAVRAQKLKYKAERDAVKARIDNLSKEDLESIKNMKLYKFYPSNDEEEYPDVKDVKSKYVNRYYGQADEVC